MNLLGCRPLPLLMTQYGMNGCHLCGYKTTMVLPLMKPSPGNTQHAFQESGFNCFQRDMSRPRGLESEGKRQPPRRACLGVKHTPHCGSGDAAEPSSHRKRCGDRRRGAAEMRLLAPPPLPLEAWGLLGSRCALFLGAYRRRMVWGLTCHARSTSGHTPGWSCPTA